MEMEKQGESQKKKNIEKDTAPLNEIDLIFKTLDKRDPCVDASREYLQLHSKTEYKCSLCTVKINRPLDTCERRFNIWLHIQDISHKSQLPNYSNMIRNVQKVLKELSKKEPHLKEDVNCFELGPVSHLVVCQICQCVVRCREHILKSHLLDKTHLANKLALNNDLKVLNVDIRNYKEFEGLIKTLPEELKEDEMYIVKGLFPGYVICRLCSNCVISTPFYLKSHLTHFWHQNNKDNPFYLPTYSRQLPNPVVALSSRIVTLFDMKFFLSVLDCDDPLIKDNAKYLSKQHGNSIFYCQLCNTKLCRNESNSLITIVADHFKEEDHIKKKIYPGSFKLSQDRFTMFDNIPEEVYEDVSSFAVLPLKDGNLTSDGEVSCFICKDSLPLDLTVFFDHVQSKQHVKNKIMLNLSHKLTKLSVTIDDVFDNLSSRDENIKSMRQYFLPNDDCSKIVCKLCNSILGNATGTIADLQKLFLRHITNEKHTFSSQGASCSSSCSDKINKSVLKNMFKKISNLDKINKKVIVISKKPGHLKCNVCKSRFSAGIEKLNNHINSNDHKKQVEIWKENTAVSNTQ